MAVAGSWGRKGSWSSKPPASSPREPSPAMGLRTAWPWPGRPTAMAEGAGPFTGAVRVTDRAKW